MAELAAPSFSLGFDFDHDSEPQQPTVREDPSSSHQAPNPSAAAANVRTFDHEDDDFETPPKTMGRDLEDPDPPSSLKRLRRGPTNNDTSDCKRKLPERWCELEDEIEEFSSPEDEPTADQPPSMVHHSVCGSSKVQLHGHRVLTTQSSKKTESISIAPSSANMERSSIKLTFPKLTTSPLRRFQLIDSDEDDASVNEGANLDSSRSALSSKQRESSPTNHASSTDWREAYASASGSRTEDLWQNFCPEKDFHIPTPALDEVCEEYFGSMKYDKAVVPSNTKICKRSNNISNNLEQQLDFVEPLPPAHSYFFHDDLRIQELVRNRLPNFFPLGVVNNRGNRQPTISDIDYLGQFNHGKGSKQTSLKSKATTSSSRRKNNSTRSNAEEVSLGWINPKLGAAEGNPKVAGKRRVQAVGQSAGHWFMGPNGKRIYVNKNGQELMGQMAYRQYKKETGTGFKRPKKKRNAKKKK